VARDSRSAKASPGTNGETVAGWAAAWLDVAARDLGSERSEETKRHYSERVRAFVRDFGDRTLLDIATPDGVEEVRKWLDQGHQTTFVTVRAMFSDAVAAGLLPSHPFRRGMDPRERRELAPVDILTPDELVALKGFAGRTLGPYGKVVYGPMIDITAWVGLGPEEVYALAPSDIDIANHGVRVWRALQGRTGELRELQHPRSVALLEPAEEALVDLGIEELPPDEPIFRTSRGGPFSQRVANYYWGPVREAFSESLPDDHWLRQRIAASGRKLEFRELQHFFGARLAERDVAPSDIAEMMGHRDGGKRAQIRYTPLRDAKARVLEAFRRAA
jgi:integrase